MRFSAFSLIAVRVWYLAIVKHDEHLRLSKKPQHRIVIETPNRGTIRDRFNKPLAVNKIRYNATVIYDPIRHLPRIKWEMVDGKKQKIFYRKNYLSNLAPIWQRSCSFLKPISKTSSDSKASLFPNTPFILKENISEAEYYRLHIMERDWPGLSVQITAERHYPRGKIGASLLGYMGAINEREYLAIQNELGSLEEYLKDKENGLPIALPKGYLTTKDVKKRVLELKDRSYTINSRVGKSGIEGRFDEELRGICGKKKSEVDIKGKFRCASFLNRMERPEAGASSSRFPASSKSMPRSF